MGNEDVFGLQVSMNDAEAVNMGKSFEYLSEKTPNFRCVLIKLSGDQIT